MDLELQMSMYQPHKIKKRVGGGPLMNVNLGDRVDESPPDYVNTNEMQDSIISSITVDVSGVSRCV